MKAIVEGALRDAGALALGGASGLIVENLGDAPFSGEQVEPHVTAMLAVVAKAVVDAFGQRLCVGVNALRNDSAAALGAAAASGSHFIRVNVHTGVMATDQGLIQGRARETLLYRKQLGLSIGIAADVLVKHATPLGEVDPVQVAQDTFHRGGADVLIYTGSGTGRPVDAAALQSLRAACPEIPFWIGSGINRENVHQLAPLCEGAIVGSFLHRDGDLRAALDLDRIRFVARALAEAKAMTATPNGAAVS
jgi:membrane complex biogenesis BtpA family protein